MSEFTPDRYQVRELVHNLYHYQTGGEFTRVYNQLERAHEDWCEACLRAYEKLIKLNGGQRWQFDDLFDSIVLGASPFRSTRMERENVCRSDAWYEHLTRAAAIRTGCDPNNAEYVLEYAGDAETFDPPQPEFLIVPCIQDCLLYVYHCSGTSWDAPLPKTFKTECQVAVDLCEDSDPLGSKLLFFFVAALNAVSDAELGDLVSKQQILDEVLTWLLVIEEDGPVANPSHTDETPADFIDKRIQQFISELRRIEMLQQQVLLPVSGVAISEGVQSLEVTGPHTVSITYLTDPPRTVVTITPVHGRDNNPILDEAEDKEDSDE
jgi:hypothetical protein